VAHVLKLDVAGMPERWISPEAAASLYATDSIAWTLGDPWTTLRGGYNRLLARRTLMPLHPIIAVKGKWNNPRGQAAVPPLTRRSLIRRDRNLCAYCGVHFDETELTTDHIMPVSRGGQHNWTNVLAACRRCNHGKSDRTPEEWGHLPLFVAYAPNRYEGLILANRRVLADQLQFLLAGVPRSSRLVQ
jgi:hypothetical protein